MPLPKSTYYYEIHKNDKVSLRNQEVEAKIKEIFIITGSAMYTVRKYLRENNSLVAEMAQTTDTVLLAQLQEQIEAALTKRKSCYPKRTFTK